MTTNDAIILSGNIKQVRIVFVQATIKNIYILLKVSSCKSFWTPLVYGATSRI